VALARSLRSAITVRLSAHGLRDLEIQRFETELGRVIDALRDDPRIVMRDGSVAPYGLRWYVQDLEEVSRIF